MNDKFILYNTRQNLIHTAGLLLLMFSITAVLAYMVAGADGIFIAALASIGAILFPKFVSPQAILRARKARPLSTSSFYRLYRLSEALAYRAGLSHQPRLYCEQSPIMNAYTTGTRDEPVIVFTDTLLKNMNIQEVEGILGHEIAHIRNNDLQVMSAAGAVQRLTGYLSIFCQLMLLIALPLIIAGQIQVSLLPLLFVIFSPTLSAVLQLALSRTREFDADLTGVELIGNPYGLASALRKMENYHSYYWRRLLFSPWSFKAPTWLQTHPPTSQRIRKLATLVNRNYFESWEHEPQTRVINNAFRHGGFPYRHMHCI